MLFEVDAHFEIDHETVEEQLLEVIHAMNDNIQLRWELDLEIYSIDHRMLME